MTSLVVFAKPHPLSTHVAILAWAADLRESDFEHLSLGPDAKPWHGHLIKRGPLRILYDKIPELMSAPELEVNQDEEVPYEVMHSNMLWYAYYYYKLAGILAELKRHPDISDFLLWSTLTSEPVDYMKKDEFKDLLSLDIMYRGSSVPISLYFVIEARAAIILAMIESVQSSSHGLMQHYSSDGMCYMATHHFRRFRMPGDCTVRGVFNIQGAAVILYHTKKSPRQWFILTHSGLAGRGLVIANFAEDHIEVLDIELPYALVDIAGAIYLYRFVDGLLTPCLNSNDNHVLTFSSKQLIRLGDGVYMRTDPTHLYKIIEPHYEPPKSKRVKSGE